MSSEKCLCCDKYPPENCQVYCRFCIPIMRRYIERGLNELFAYLAKWAAFEAIHGDNQ